jgi:cytochrome bd-type quinol oxidase subunit 2
MDTLSFFLYKIASPAFAAPTSFICPAGSSVHTEGIFKGLPCDRPVKDLDTALTAVKNLTTQILLPLVGVLFSIMFLYGALQYITSNGNQQRAEAGKKTLTFAIGGLVLIILAEIIIGLYVKALGGSVG